ncbi:hypothetical protein [Bradyrhizobium arachidis]|uniref:Uncharacterized protein n=1 Tax=Bradyrhizobium arachidis TaxID=858423 RepID=A0AAE7NQF7_9BRAD|nr:hypothetical protein [Bradyrhizobium arachidis]QOZ70139.1 hypothetical protein WN72_30405 [Bradyrhizobium arachidis]
MLKVDPPWQALLSSLAHPALLQFYYTCEVRVVVNATIGILEPVSGVVYIAKQIDEIHLDSLKRSTAVLGNTPSEDLSFPLIAVVASFARNDLLFGARGYRHALMEAGQLCREITRAAAAGGIDLDCYLEFIDADVDQTMECDGLEECVVALLCSRR